MPASIVALSDLHLGYDRSLLGTEAAREGLAEVVADLSGGVVDHLVLDGDALEICVPRDAGMLDDHGFPAETASCSRDLFAALCSTTKIGQMTFVWGNHDLALWKRVATMCQVPTTTGLGVAHRPSCDLVLQEPGGILPGSASFLDDFVGPARARVTSVTSAYPNLVVGDGWPYVVFHHGHLLDSLVLGQDSEAKYAALLAAAGASRPAVNVHDVDLTVKKLCDLTTDFVCKVWEYDSLARRVEWSVMRRFSPVPPCPRFPTEPAPAHRAVLPPEPPTPGLASRWTWYADLLLRDPSTPAPVGADLRVRSDLSQPSYLVVGHDHRGGQASYADPDGAEWRLVDCGGWTDDDGDGRAHCHVVVWRRGEPEPEVHCARIT